MSADAQQQRRVRELEEEVEELVAIGGKAEGAARREQQQRVQQLEKEVKEQRRRVRGGEKFRSNHTCTRLLRLSTRTL